MQTVIRLLALVIAAVAISCGVPEEQHQAALQEIQRLKQELATRPAGGGASGGGADLSACQVRVKQLEIENATLKSLGQGQ